jgi:hypothetical protein
MPIYVIHIGPPKAGSKYIQSSCAALTDELKKSGILYPTTLFSDRRLVWHEPLCNRIRAGGDADLVEKFRELNASDLRYVVLSFEGFFGLSEENLHYLRELTGNCEVQFVYYCRRWSERLPSLWKQDIKEGYVETFPEKLARFMRNPVKTPDLNHRLIWDKFAGIFGRESIRLVSFNNLVEHKVDLVEHFLAAFLDWRYASAPEDTFANESPDTFDIEILRALNAIHLRRDGKTSDRVRVQFLKKRERLDVAELMASMAQDLQTVVVSDKDQVFNPVYADLSSYNDRLVSPEYGATVFTRKATEFEYVRQNYLIDESVVRRLNALYDETMSLAQAA